MGKCNINLAVTFNSTADTERLRAHQIAERVANFLAVELEAANLRVEVHGATLNYTEAWERENEAFETARRTIEVPDDEAEEMAARHPWGNPATDSLN